MASESDISPPVATFSIGWIAALSHELTAARLMLDKEYSDAPQDFEPSSSDTNTYTFGRVGRHHVVLAVLGAGDYGLVSAAETASRLSASIPHIRIGLMVGIGAGVGTRHDIRLGDVAVSEPTVTHGGLVQYDLYKATVDSSNRHERRTRFLNRPPRALLTALQKLKSSHEMDESRMEEYIGQLFHRRPKLKKSFGFPGRQHDPYASTNVRSHDRDEDDSDTSRVYYGIIASGNVLLKDSRKRDEVLDLLADENIRPICFEMEAAGLMNVFSCLVIRGICDYADEKKNNMWQKYAALVAAAYAKDLLCHVDKREIDTGPQLAQLLKNIQTLHTDLRDVKNDTASMKKTMSADDFSKLVNWLCPSDFSLQYTKKKAERLSGTGKWFLEDYRYKAWKEQKRSSALYCEGAPGAGKSMLAAMAAETLLGTVADAGTAILVLFCDYARRKEQSKSSFVSTILRQLLHQIGHDSYFAEELLKPFRASKQSSDLNRPSFEAVEKILLVALKQYKCVYLVMDALDECDFTVSQEFFGLIHPSRPQKDDDNAENDNDDDDSGGVFKLLATSRYNPHFKKLLSTPVISLPIKADVSDIDLYVRRRSKELEIRIPDRPDLLNEVIRNVVRTVDGIFLLAHLHMNNIVQHDTPNDVRAALEALATGKDAYHQAYQQTLERITSRSRKLTVRALSILIWVAYAKRPLSPKELQRALATKLGHDFLDPDDIPSVTALLSVCEGLVILSSSGIAIWSTTHHQLEVRLVHFTAEQYLKDLGTSWYSAAHLADPHLTLASTCLTYLAIDKTSSTCSKVDTLSLEDYASRFAGVHTREAEVACAGSANDRRTLDHAAFRYLCQGDEENYGHAVWFLVLNDLLRLFLAFRANLAYFDCKNNVFWTPLIHAADRGNTAMVRALLETNKIAVNAADIAGHTAFSRAVANGHRDVVRLLIDTGQVDTSSIHLPFPPVQFSHPQSRPCPLWQAIEGGHETIIRDLIDCKTVDWDRTDAELRTPLHLAMTRGQHVIAALILTSDQMEDIDVDDRCSDTPFSLAARYGYESIVGLLVQTRKVRLDHQAQWRVTPLCAAAKRLHANICRIICNQMPKESRLASLRHAYLYCLMRRFLYRSKATENALSLLESLEPSLSDDRRQIMMKLPPHSAASLMAMAAYWLGVAECDVCQTRDLQRGLCCSDCVKGKIRGLSICFRCIEAGYWCYCNGHVLQEYDGRGNWKTLLSYRERQFRDCTLEERSLTLGLRQYRTLQAICNLCGDLHLSHGLHCTLCSGFGFNVCMTCVEEGGWCRDFDHTLSEIQISEAMKSRVLRVDRFVKARSNAVIAHIAAGYLAEDMQCCICRNLTGHGFHCARCPSPRRIQGRSCDTIDVCVRCVRQGHWCGSKAHLLQEYNSSTLHVNGSAWRSFTDTDTRRSSISSFEAHADHVKVEPRDRRSSTSSVGNVDWRACPANPYRWLQAGSHEHTNPHEIRSPRSSTSTLICLDYFKCKACGLYRAHSDRQSDERDSTCLYCALGIIEENLNVETKWCRRGHHSAPRKDFFKMRSDIQLGKERPYCRRHRRSQTSTDFNKSQLNNDVLGRSINKQTRPQVTFESEGSETENEGESEDFGQNDSMTSADRVVLKLTRMRSQSLGTTPTSHGPGQR